MKKLQKYTKPIYVLTVLSAMYLTIRLLNLTLFPIFTDEAIYIYWAKTIEQSMSQFFISVADGKPPLFIWTTSIFLKLFPDQTFLYAARLVSVLAGLATLLGVYKLSLLLFNSHRSALISSLLYAVLPFSVMYERLALLESMLSALLIWAVYFTRKTAQKQKIIYAALWGMFLGLALLTKTTAIAFVALTPIVFIIFSKNRRENTKQIVLHVLVAVAISQSVFNMLRVSSVFPLMDAKNTEFTRSFYDVLNSHISIYTINFFSILNSLTTYITPPLILTVGISFVFLIKNGHLKQVLSLLILTSIPIVALSIVGKIIYPRYVFFTIPYALISAGCFISTYSHSKNKTVKSLTISLFIVCVIWATKNSLVLVTSPQHARLPTVDSDQFVTRSPSGYGLDEAISFFNSKQSATIITQGTFGLFPYALNLEYWNSQSYTIIPTHPLALPEDIQQKENVYFLIQNEEAIPNNIKYTIIKEIYRPQNLSTIIIAKPAK